MKLSSVLSLFLGCLLTCSAAPVSIPSDVSPQNSAGGVGSHTPSISADGRCVVFLSAAKNLTTASSLTPYLDVFVHDLQTTNITLVSVAAPGTGSGNDDSVGAAVSANGQYIAFASSADNLTRDDARGTSDIFLRDMQTAITSIVSIGLDGSPAKPVSFAGPDGLLRANVRLSRNPVVSSDGRWVAFESAATNLVSASDANVTNDVFIRDTLTGVAHLISADPSGHSAGNALSGWPALSGNARRIAFLSYATDLVSGVTNTHGDVYVRDMDSNATLWASGAVGSYFSNGNYRCYAPVLSGNGEVAAFKAAALNAATGLLFRVDVATGTASLLNSNSPIAVPPYLSDDGRCLAYDDGANVYVWDQQLGSNRLVSARFDGSGAGNGLSISPVMSANGRMVAFVSTATDLLGDQPAGTNGLFQIFVRDLQTRVGKLLTADSHGQPMQANHLLANIALSADGTRIAFDSHSDRLVAGDANRESDVFVADLVQSRTWLVSRREDSQPSVTRARHVRTAPDCVSTNGRYLLFASMPKTSLREDAACCENLFIRDLLTGAEEQITDFDVVEPKEFVLSADARHVAYITRGVVGPRDENAVLLNRDTGVRVVINVDPNSSGLLTHGIHGLTLSPAGNRVAYVTGLTSASDGHLYMFDSVLGTNRRLTPVTYPHPYVARFSPDGRLLVFGQAFGLDRFSGTLLVYDLLTNGVSAIRPTNSSVFVRPHSFSADSRYLAADHSLLEIFDLQSMTRRTFETNFVRYPILSADGRWVAYENRAFPVDPVVGDDGAREIRVRNLQNGVTKAATRSLSGADSGNGRSKSVGFSFDGRFVVFSSRASDLVPGDTNRLRDVFAYDVITGTTFLLSINRSGTSPGSGVSSVPILGADGRTVIFQSFADDLVEGDYNFARDVFIARLGGIDSDGDGMDDDWEMAYFESLVRDGSGDLDGDGTSDSGEFLAGTDPTNLGSVLRVITVAPMSGGQSTVLWASSPGRTYRVQFKDDIDAATWTDLPGTVRATGSTASMLDATASLAHRYYRVILP